MSDTSLLFGPLDTPGPVYHRPIVPGLYAGVQKQTLAEAQAKNGLYLQATAGQTSLQTIALLLPASMSWGPGNGSK